MPRKKSYEKELGKLIEAILALTIIIVLLSVWIKTESLVLSFGAVGGVLGLYIAILIIIRQQKAERLRQSGIKEIDEMDGITVLYMA